MNQGNRYGAGGKTNRQGRPRREPLNDHYYYQEPPEGRRSAVRDSFEDISSYSSPKEKRRQQAQTPRKKKRGNGRRKAAAFLCILLLLLGAGAWYIFGYLLGGLTVKNINRENLGIGLDAFSDGSVKNIALFGLDARENVYEGRSDALMVLSVDNRRKKLKLTSILRDSEVSIEGYQDKITHAYAYGGAELAIKTINQNFHLDIEDYVTVNFVQMAEIVDAFGGTRVTISYDEAMEINNNLALLASESHDADVEESDFLYEDGDVLLNGNQAVAYARIRYLDGDDVRASRQQKVLKGLISQLRGISKVEYPNLIRRVAPLCETSLSIGDMMGMAPILFSDFTVETLSVPGSSENAADGYTDDGSWVFVYDLEAASQHISNFIYEEDSPYYEGAVEGGGNTE